jgi:hypothetical protein
MRLNVKWLCIRMHNRAFYSKAVNEPLEVAEMHSRVCIVMVVDMT